MNRRLFKELVLRNNSALREWKKAPAVTPKKEATVWIYVAMRGKNEYFSSAEFNPNTNMWEAMQTFFETEDDALNGGWLHMQELDNEGELLDDNDRPIDIDDLDIIAKEIPISQVSDEDLEFSDLEDLIDLR